ncbi:MAG TPA: hypothetical protein VLA79_05145, partial [Polyangia bacterium]|nr:hypothetical protein [Polyangia bacterium]
SRPKSITALSIETLTDQVTISTVPTAVLGVMVTENVADPEAPPVPEAAPPAPVVEPPVPVVEPPVAFEPPPPLPFDPPAAPPVPSELPEDLHAAGDNATETSKS